MFIRCVRGFLKDACRVKKKKRKGKKIESDKIEINKSTVYSFTLVSYTLRFKVGYVCTFLKSWHNFLVEIFNKNQQALFCNFYLQSCPDTPESNDQTFVQLADMPKR